jgi:cystathionine gamma-lyase
MKFETQAIHAGVNADPTTGAIMTPIYQTSTYVQAAPGEHKGYEYSRTHNPTRTALQNNMAALENGKWALGFASGMAAVDGVIKLLKPGDEVIASNDLYGGTYRIFTKVFTPLGIKFHFVDMADENSVKEKITSQTKMIWAETPTNPLLKIVDLSKMAVIAKTNSLILAVDNTFASPYLQQPLNLGADLVIHSATKYIGGHSDLVLGIVCGTSSELHERLSFMQNSCGGVPGPMDCFLAIRGLKTLHIRLDRHCENGEKIAYFLKNHPKVAKVYWPGFEEHPGHEIAKKQMKKFGGMLSFELKNNSTDKAKDFLSSLKIFALAESLGGVESLAGHPATMTHASIPKTEREKAGLKDSLIRLSVGIENIDDLITDLDQALINI